MKLNQLSFPSTKIISTNYYPFQIHLPQGDKNIECQFGDSNNAYFARSLIRNRVFNSKRFCLTPSTWRRIRKLLLLFFGGFVALAAIWGSNLPPGRILTLILCERKMLHWHVLKAKWNRLVFVTKFVQGFAPQFSEKNSLRSSNLT